MGRQPCLIADGLVYHALNRGNNRQTVFFDADDFQSFLVSLRQTKERYPFSLFATMCAMNCAMMCATNFATMCAPNCAKLCSRARGGVVQSLAESLPGGLNGPPFPSCALVSIRG